MNPLPPILIYLLAMEGFIRLARRFRPVPILLYHFIDGEAEKKGLSVSLSRFQEQVLYLLRHNFRIISLREFLKSKQEKIRLPDRSVVITFDDGDKAFYTKVYPFLDKYQLPATVFVITGWIGKPGYLTWDDLRSMSSDLVTVGSHTVSHRYLPELDLAEIKKELVESKQALEEGLHRKIECLSYPVGGFNQEIARLAQEAGYLAACTTNRGRNFFQKDLFALKRVKMTEKTIQPYVLAAKFSGYYQIAGELFPKQPGLPLSPSTSNCRLPESQ